MNRLFETLESRTLMSGTMTAVAFGPVEAHPAAVHVSASEHTTAVFNGTAATADGTAVATLQMTVTRSGHSVRAVLTATGGDGKLAHYNLKLGAGGSFSFDSKEKGVRLHVQGRLSADGQSVSGTFAQTRKDGSTSGTISLALADDASGGR